MQMYCHFIMTFGVKYQLPKPQKISHVYLIGWQKSRKTVHHWIENHQQDISRLLHLDPREQNRKLDKPGLIYDLVEAISWLKQKVERAIGVVNEIEFFKWIPTATTTYVR